MNDGSAHPTGLTAVEVAERRAIDGPNRLPQPRRPGALAQVAGQLTHFFALLLWVAGALAIVGGLVIVAALLCKTLLDARRLPIPRS